MSSIIAGDMEIELHICSLAFSLLFEQFLHFLVTRKCNNFVITCKIRNEKFVYETLYAAKVATEVRITTACRMNNVSVY